MQATRLILVLLSPLTVIVTTRAARFGEWAFSGTATDAGHVPGDVGMSSWLPKSPSLNSSRSPASGAPMTDLFNVASFKVDLTSPGLRTVKKKGPGSLQACQGDCTKHSDCAEGLKCWQRSGLESIPGCSGFGVPAMDYCVDPQKYIRKLKEPDSPKPGLDETYKVLSYNICWGCMEADLRDKTAMKDDLKTWCMQREKFTMPMEWTKKGENNLGLTRTRCATNIGKSIGEYNKQAGGYDFIAFQEASNFRDLLLPARGVALRSVEWGASLKEDVLHEQGKHKGQRKNTWINTLYNEKKMGSHSTKVTGVLKDDEGRPYMILIFDVKQVMFINFHNAQPRRSGGTNSWSNFGSELNEQLEVEAFRDKPERKNYRVIMAGDFNDLHGKLPGNVTLPWLSRVRLRLDKPMPKTCCSAQLDEDPRGYGDYIFDSHSVASNKVPSGFNRKLPQSDHLPVEAVLAGGPRPYTTAETSGSSEQKLTK